MWYHQGMPAQPLPDLDFLDLLEDVVLDTMPKAAQPFMQPLPRPQRHRQRDTDRSRVYRAEGVFHPRTSPNHLRGVDRYPVVYMSRAEVIAFVRKVEASDFWGDHACTAAQCAPVRVTTNGKRRGTARYQNNTINMPEWTWYDEYILHELAHLAVGAAPIIDGTEAAHGLSFRTMLHGLIREFMGHDAAVAFATGCRRERLALLAFADAPIDTHTLPLAAGESSDNDAVSAWAGYVESYRKYRTGGRSSAPKPRKGMTDADVARVRAVVDAGL